MKGQLNGGCAALVGQQKALREDIGKLEVPKNRGKGSSSFGGMGEFMGSDKGEVFWQIYLRNIQKIDLKMLSGSTAINLI